MRRASLVMVVGGLCAACEADPVAVPIEPGADHRTLVLLVESPDAEAPPEDRVLSLTVHDLRGGLEGELVTLPRSFDEARVTAFYYREALEDLALTDGGLPLPAPGDRRRAPRPADAARFAAAADGAFVGWQDTPAAEAWGDIEWPLPDPCWRAGATVELPLADAADLMGLVEGPGETLFALVWGTSTTATDLYRIDATTEAVALTWRVTDLGRPTALAALGDGSLWVGDGAGRVAQLELRGDEVFGGGVEVSDARITDIAGAGPAEVFVADAMGGLYRGVEGVFTSGPPRDVPMDDFFLHYRGPEAAFGAGTSGKVARWAASGPTLGLGTDDLGVAVTAVGHSGLFGDVVLTFDGAQPGLRRHDGAQWIDQAFTSSTATAAADGQAFGLSVVEPDILVGAGASLLHFAPSVVDPDGEALDLSRCPAPVAEDLGPGPVRYIVRFGEWWAVGGRAPEGASPADRRAGVRFLRLSP